MIRIIDDQTKRFIDFLNQNYGTEAECIVSVFNCQDSVCVSEDGKEEQSLFIPEADLVMLTTEKPANGIFDSAGNPAPKFYEDNYTLIKLAHEYGHFLQKYGKLPNPEDLEENEKVADLPKSIYGIMTDIYGDNLLGFVPKEADDDADLGEEYFCNYASTWTDTKGLVPYFGGCRSGGAGAGAFYFYCGDSASNADVGARLAFCGKEERK